MTHEEKIETVSKVAEDLGLYGVIALSSRTHDATSVKILNVPACEALNLSYSLVDTTKQLLEHMKEK